MPGLSHTEIIGFASNVEKALEKERDALAAIGIDPEVFIGRVRAANERAVSLNAKQEALKTETVATTTEYVAAIRELYVVSSGALDTLIAAVGKNTDAAKVHRQLRSRIRRRRRREDGGSDGP